MTGLKNVHNVGRFEWIFPHILVDTANNEQNIKILAKMLNQIGHKKKMTIIFGTTQTEPLYAAELANLIPSDRKILVDDFCERALPCSEFSHLIPHNAVWHLNAESGIQKIKSIFEKNNEEIFIIC
jgi:folylpolyglutamate synthase/dihydropteroate synthase